MKISPILSTSEIQNKLRESYDDMLTILGAQYK